jgi:hypothetical protein
MPEEKYSILACWADRKESVHECARRAAECFRLLGLCDEALNHWVKPGTLRKAENSTFKPTFEALQSEVYKGLYRRDSDRSVIEDLGSDVFVWNGDSGAQSARIHISCGAFSDNASIPATNKCVVELPFGGPTAARILQVDKIMQVLRAVVVAWDPDWSRFTSSALLQVLFDQVSDRDMVGWLTYFSDRYGPLPTLPSEFDIARLDGFGSVIIIRTKDWFTASNPEHLSTARRLVSITENAGLLRRVPKQILRSPGEASRSEPDVVGQSTQSSATKAGQWLNLKYLPTPENARLFAADIVAVTKHANHRDLDYSETSLKNVDAILEEMRLTGISSKEIAETLFGFGCYVGEVFVRNAGAQWRKTEDTRMQGVAASPLVLELPNHNYCNPIGKTFKRFENGEVDKLSYFFQVFTEGLSG